MNKFNTSNNPIKMQFTRGLNFTTKQKSYYAALSHARQRKLSTSDNTLHYK